MWKVELRDSRFLLGRANPKKRLRAFCSQVLMILHVISRTCSKARVSWDAQASQPCTRTPCACPECTCHRSCIHGAHMSWTSTHYTYLFCCLLYTTARCTYPTRCRLRTQTMSMLHGYACCRTHTKYTYMITPPLRYTNMSRASA